MEYTKRLETIEISKLIPYVNNARTHSPEQIIKIQSSIREFGFVNPVLIDGKYNIIAGHGRIMAAKAEGIDKVPCLFVEHLTETQKKAYILADNRLALDAGWDMDILKLEIKSLQEMDLDILFTGFEMDELQFDLDGLELDENEIESDENDSQTCFCPKCGFEFEVNK